MKVVLGIILIALIVARIGFYILFMLNSHGLVYCGDLKSDGGTTCLVTRVYSSDLDANETLSQIVATMNDNENGNLTAEEMTEILATYQNIIYAPAFVMEMTQEDTNTFVITGSIFNGLDSEGNPSESDFRYTNLTLTAGVFNGKVLAAQNVYSQDVNDDGQYEFKARNNVVDPVLLDGNAGAAFSFTDCDSFRIVFTGEDDVPASMTFAFTYDVVAQNPLNFTNITGAAIGITITEAYDEAGRLRPEITLEKVYSVNEEE